MMTQVCVARRLVSRFLFVAAGVLAAVAASAAQADPAQPGQPGQPGLKEPVFRVSKSVGESGAAVPMIVAQPMPVAEHPLDPAVHMARFGLEKIHADIKDYTCELVKRENVGGKLYDHEYMFCKIRHEQIVDGEVKVPFAVYLYFRAPDSVKGREVIWVKGQNNNKMIAHEGGLKGRLLPSVWLNPDGPLAMAGQRYPITEIGIETLTRRLIERGESDRQYGEIEVQTFKGAKINGRVCTCLQFKHPEKRPHFTFYLARIFIDDEMQIPVRYEAFDWPINGAQPGLQEEYTYLNVKLNVGLTDADFDHTDPKYGF
jgi:hypothetical protein